MINIVDATVEAVLFAIVIVNIVGAKLYFPSQVISYTFFSDFCSLLWCYGVGVLDWVFAGEGFS